MRAPLLACAALALLMSIIPLSIPPANAAELTGTWQGAGTLGGEVTEIAVGFSEEGFWLFTYEDNRGNVRTVQLDEPGQVRFVPPGGGVKTVRILSVDKRPGGLSYVLETSFERTSGGILDQQYASEEYEFKLTSEGLAFRRVSRAASYVGDRGGPMGRPKAQEVFEAILKKVD
jgi:hypothetical protein